MSVVDPWLPPDALDTTTGRPAAGPTTPAIPPTAPTVVPAAGLARLAAAAVGADAAAVLLTDPEPPMSAGAGAATTGPTAGPWVAGAAGLDAAGVAALAALHHALPCPLPPPGPVALADLRAALHPDPGLPAGALDALGGFGSYLGVPLRTGAGTGLGVLCVLARGARPWHDEEVERLTDLATLVTVQLALPRTLAREAAARADARHFRALVEHTSELIALLDAAGRIAYTSPAYHRVIGYAPGALLGTVALDRVHPEDHAGAAAALDAVLADRGVRREVTLRFATPDGGWRRLQVAAENLLDDPAVGAVVVNARDVTVQGELEEQLRQAQKMEAVGRLAGGVAHDFNNVLTVIGASLRFARDVLPPEVEAAAAPDLDEIEQGVRRAGTLTRQLLAFSRRQPHLPQLLRVDDVVRGMERMIRRVVGEDVELVAAADARVGLVRADPGQLEQVLMNLVVNARDAMPQGGVLIVEAQDCRLTPETAAPIGVAPGRWAVLEVGDTGIGMDAATQDRMFEPFFTTKAPGRGTGLGLATVYGIVAQSGGHVRVRSAPGRGTTFRIYLPVVPEGTGADAAGESAAPAAGARAAGSAGAGVTVLVVEDESAVRYVVRRALERHGYRVLEARHGADGLALWEREGGPAGAIALVLPDLTMPARGGRELVPRLLERRPGQRVLVMTGYAGDEGRSWAETSGVPVLDKPFDAEELVSRVRALVEAPAGAG